MKPANLRLISAAALLAILIVAVPSEAAKRRVVAHRPLPQPAAGTIVGTIYDIATGQPVRGMTVNVADFSTSTDVHGRFEMSGLDTTKPIVIETERSGYQPTELTLPPNQPRNVTIRVTSTPTMTIRMVNNTVHHVDYESLKFGYPIIFGGYAEAPAAALCKTDGTKATINRSQMKRLAGPAQLVPGGPCCNSGNAAKMTLTLRTGETSEVLFTDTCGERNRVDIGVRDHVSGEFLHLLITDIAEVLFP